MNMSIIKNESASSIHDQRVTQRTSLSANNRRKVSFEDESRYFFDFGSIATATATSLLHQDHNNFAPSIFKEEKRVVSTDTIGTPMSAPTVAPTPTHSLGLTMKKNKSKSLSSLNRSGNLKLLMEQQSGCFATQIPTPAVSEDCLSSSIHEEEMMHPSLLATHSDSCNCYQLRDLSQSSMSTSSGSEGSNMPAHTSCTGWGQFVDFTMPSESVFKPSSRRKSCLPKSRRRSSSFSLLSSTTRYSKYRLQKYSREQMRTTKWQSPPNNMYSKNQNNSKFFTSSSSLSAIKRANSDIDMVAVFRDKLSITKK